MTNLSTDTLGLNNEKECSYQVRLHRALAECSADTVGRIEGYPCDQKPLDYYMLRGKNTQKFRDVKPFVFRRLHEARFNAVEIC